MEPLFLALASGLLTSLGVAFVAGLLSVFTPCVLPMVPITLAVLGASKEATRRQAFAASAAYVGGIVVTFTTLGVAFGLAGGLFGSWLAHPATNVAVAGLFLVLAANAFGMFEVGLPARLANLFSRVGGRGPAGAFAMGLVAGFIATPCVGAVLAGILAYVSTTGDALRGALLLAAYGIGFGLPFLLAGTFALRLPKSGPWLAAVKVLFGLALCAGAAWFLRSAWPDLARPRSMQLVLVTAIVAAILVIVGKSAQEGGGKARFLALPSLAAAIAACTASAAFAINTLTYVPATVPWCAESPDGTCLPATCRENGLTVVDFSASWCGACQEMEAVTFSDPEVVEAIRGHGRVRVDVDENGDLSRTAGIESIPAVVFLDSSCREVRRFNGYRDPEHFLEELRAAEAAAR